MGVRLFVIRMIRKHCCASDEPEILSLDALMHDLGRFELTPSRSIPH
jgi:hypothetical protein